MAVVDDYKCLTELLLWYLLELRYVSDFLMSERRKPSKERLDGCFQSLFYEDEASL